MTERFTETADAMNFSGEGFELHNVLRGDEQQAKRALVNSGMPVDYGRDLGVGWLAAASRHYNISPDPKDYVMAPVTILVSSIPNRNGVAFPLRELAEFDPEMGMLSYQTWGKKPVFYEHDNQDHTKALGVIFDVHMSAAPQFAGDTLHKVITLCGVDRTRSPMLANRLLTGSLRTWSMGATLTGYECSVCGHRPSKANPKCEHFGLNNRNMRIFEDAKRGRVLAHYICSGIRGFETSMVEVPAWASAQHADDQLLLLNDG